MGGGWESDESTGMKFLILLLMACTFCGCAQRYRLTMHNRQELTTTSRPKYDKATQTYRFKDDAGRPAVIPAFRVKEIEPL